MNDWHALAARHGPQRAAYQRDAPAPLPPTRCGRCGKALRPPAIVVTRTAALCPACAGQVPDERPEPPLYGGRRIEDLTWQAHALLDKLKARRWHFRGNPAGYGIGYTGDDLERAILAAYRRYWRRKRIWLAQGTEGR